MRKGVLWCHLLMAVRVGEVGDRKCHRIELEPLTAASVKRESAVHSLRAAWHRWESKEKSEAVV